MPPMKTTLLTISLSTLLLGACSTVPQARGRMDDAYGPNAERTPRRVSGLVGVMEVTTFDLSLKPGLGQVVSDNDITMPMFGAQTQIPIRSGGIEFGFEAGFSFGWKSDREAIQIDDGTFLITSDNQVRIGDLSGGLYVAVPIGERARIYGGAGPVLQWTSVDLEFDSPLGGNTNVDENGFGAGYYARTGVDVDMGQGTLVGLFGRWVDSSADLGGPLDDVELETIQFGLSVTASY